MRLFALLVILFGAHAAARAEFVRVWSVGTLDGDPLEFTEEIWQSNAPPGSATVADCDYYFGGTYADPIGSVVTEPVINFKETLSGLPNAGQPGNEWATDRIHFHLSAGQATATSRIRLTIHQLWGGWWVSATESAGEGYGAHTFEVRLNGQLLGVRTVSEAGTVIVEADAGVFTPTAGANVLQLTRTGGAENGWFSFDSLTFEINPSALLDADGDNLPRWWEEEQGFSDSDGGDASQDSDNDGLTNAQEFARGTSPRLPDTDNDGLTDGVETGTGVFVSATNTGTDPLLADTDGDSLSDGAEVALTPMPSPLLADTDGDGAADSWEVRTGYNPAAAASEPPAFSGAVGIHFVHEIKPTNALSALAVTGLLPQANWNNTRPLTSWNDPAGGNEAIASPVVDSLVNCAGTPSPVSVTWNSPGHFWASGNGGEPTRDLLGGYLNVNSDDPGTVSLANIPFGSYDLIVYVGGVYDGAVGVTRLGNDPATDRWFITCSTAPQANLVEPTVSDFVKPWRGNAIHYRGLSGGSQTVTLFRAANGEVGIHAIQIVDMSVDDDGDGMPTAWEFAHRLRANFNDPGQDADGDGLSNAGEFANRTDPRNADTDGDGLNDAAELATLTNPLVADSDSDGLTDGAELNRIPSPTNPNSADSDNDGRSDADEIAYGTDPNSPDTASAYVPRVTTSPRVLDWTLDNMQIVLDHTRAHLSEREWGADELIGFAIRNSAVPDQDAMSFGLTRRNGSLTHYFYSNHNSAFSHPTGAGDDIYDGDWNNPPADLRAGLGFSGYGAADVSDRLRLRIHATSAGSQSGWVVDITLTNLDRQPPLVVYSESFAPSTAADSVHNGTAQWHDRQNPPNLNRFHLYLHDGARVFFQSTRLEDTPAFAAHKDSDNDGMPDAWEDGHGLNKNSAADAALDPDADGLSNVNECLAGTLPNQSDTDGDKANDGLEVSHASNPLLATSLPPFYRGPPAGTLGEDFNGNGMADAWELWAGSFTLPPTLDTDGDGQSNLAEAAAGTDPFDAGSRLWSQGVREGANLTLIWPLLNHKLHQVWQSPDVRTWSYAGGTPLAVGGEMRQTLAGILNGAPKFFAARVTDLDSDNDGVSDWTEANVTNSTTTAANSTRGPAPVDANQDGVPEATLSGDYASLLDRLLGGNAGGGFAGGAAANGISRGMAARFLTQSTFGPTPEDIERVQQLGYSAWINEQETKAATAHTAYIRECYEDMLTQRSGATGYNRGGGDSDPFLFGNNMMTAFARAAIQGEDQLRQRVAFALSQILVTSRRDANLENRCLGMADYYDIFVRHAFGNYLDILREVTFHPMMGSYLSHVGNQKARPEINQYPDENYAREVMQLFTIGLWRLNPDGSRQLNAQGQPIPTYSNAEITQLARVVTGLWFGGHHWGGGGWTESDYATPMTMHADKHDFDAKTLVGGYVIPARAATPLNAELDIQDALRHLFNHPNTGAFIGKQLIQFLVTDNPSPGYVRRVGAIFANNGQGVRGDLGAVVRAILLDEEARDSRYAESKNYGRLKEPVIRVMALGRAFGMKQARNLLWWDWSDFANVSRQEPTGSPSVFNFYRPDYRPPGLLTENELAGPVFQITDSYSSISFPNHLWQMLEEGFSLWDAYRFPVDLAKEKSLSAAPEQLVDYLNSIFCGGRMHASTRTLIVNAISQIPASEAAARARVAAYLVMTCPEGAVQK